MDQDDESYILLILSDSNLPTGSFVASAGLESYITHGFFEKWRSSADYTATINFLRDSIGSYARAALSFVTDAHDIMSEALLELGRTQDLHVAKDKAIEALSALDNLYERMSLNHVTRRASRAQGVALLTLYSRGFARPIFSQSSTDDSVECSSEDARAKHAAEIIDALKLLVRREQIPGHLPICWGILTAALNLSGHRSQYLHLFLQARGLLSASVRLNTIGPYASQQLLLHVVKPLVEFEAKRCANLRTGITFGSSTSVGENSDIGIVGGPANTWPLGEILAARHDAQHSRIFNS